MQLEYFILIDRILDLNIDEKTIQVEAQVPQHSTISLKYSSCMAGD